LRRRASACNVEADSRGTYRHQHSERHGDVSRSDKEAKGSVNHNCRLKQKPWAAKYFSCRAWRVEMGALGTPARASGTRGAARHTVPA
jgi:hypothetical protein